MTRRFAARAGGIALIASLFLPWYRAAGWYVYDAWEAFAALDIVLLVLGVAAFAAPRTAGALATVILLTRVADDAHEAGAWIALAASLTILVAGGRPEWRRPPLIAAAGALLLVAALLAPWYGFVAPPAASSPPPPTGYEPGVIVASLYVGPRTLSGWQAFELVPVGLTIAAGLAFARRRSAVLAGPAALALVLYALLAPPEPWSDLRSGLWLALAGAVLLLTGAGSNRLRARAQVAP